jgi:hypothetical protein
MYYLKRSKKKDYTTGRAADVKWTANVLYWIELQSEFVWWLLVSTDSISRQHLNGRSSVDWRARSHVMTAWSSAEVCLTGGPVIVFSLGVVVGVCCAGTPTAKLPKMVRAYTRPCE